MENEVVILLKPDVFERRLWGVALEWLQKQSDFVITDFRMYRKFSPELDGRLVLHYQEHEGKDFYPGLMEFMRSGHIGAFLGETHSIPALRSVVQRFRDSWHSRGAANLLHCSDSKISGLREKGIWFGWR